jgi:hypothetical protein
MVANGQVKPAPSKMKAVPVPVPLSAEEKLTRVRTILKAQTKIKFDSAKLDSAKLGGPLCAMSIKTPIDGDCKLLGFDNPISVQFDNNLAWVSKSSAVDIDLSTSKPGLYILDFSVSDELATIPNHTVAFDAFVDGQAIHQEISVEKQGGHLIVPINATSVGQHHFLSLRAGSVWVFHSLQVTKLY